MPTVASILQLFHQSLDALYDANEVETFARLSLEHYSAIPYVAFRSNLDVQVDDALFNTYADIVTALKQHRPIQYILGQTEFYGLQLKVTSAVLIPRPETEELVDLIVKVHSQANELRILDICTGSGCIALALNKNLLASAVWGIDVSPEALAVAKQNNELNNCDVNFIEADVLSDNTFGYPNNLDVVVSNPPYVPHSELESIAANVKEYEPHLALFVPDNDPLLFYKKISTLAFERLLKPGGRLYFECYTNHAAEVVNLLANLGYNSCKVVKDMSGRDRMVSAVKN